MTKPKPPYCDQLTSRGYPCSRSATIVAPGLRGEERYCTQHANIHGVSSRRRWWRLER